MPASDDTMEFDAGDLSCGTGLPQEFRRRLTGVPAGGLLRVVAKDPTARVDLPSLARMLGHEVVSVGTTSDGRISIEVRRKKE